MALFLLSEEGVHGSGHGARVEPVLLVRQRPVLLEQEGRARAEAHGAPHAVVGLAQVRVEVVHQEQRRGVGVVRHLRADGSERKERSTTAKMRVKFHRQAYIGAYVSAKARAQ